MNSSFNSHLHSRFVEAHRYEWIINLLPLEPEICNSHISGLLLPQPNYTSRQRVSDKETGLRPLVVYGSGLCFYWNHHRKIVALVVFLSPDEEDRTLSWTANVSGTGFSPFPFLFSCFRPYWTAALCDSHSYSDSNAIFTTQAVSRRSSSLLYGWLLTHCINPISCVHTK